MATKKTAATSPVKTAARKSSPAKAPAKTSAKAAAKTAPKTEAKPETGATKATATHQQIAELAHTYFTERGHAHGSHVADWLRAEKELNS